MSRVIPSGADGGPLFILEDRHTQILTLLAGAGSVKVAELSRRFGVSEVTVRADLERLARQGLLVRFRGGAVAKVDTSVSTAFAVRARNRQPEKERIARCAAKFVCPGDTIFLDAGSTTMEFAKRLEGRGPLTVVTNALNTAAMLSGFEGIQVILAGGSVSPETVSTVGQIAERDLTDFVGDVAFIGAHSFSPELGILDVSVEVARVKSAMIQAVGKVLLLADSSKFRARSLAKVAPLSVAKTVITDTDLSDGDTTAIEALGVEVLRV